MADIQDTFDRKIEMIKAVRNHADCGLKEAKDLVDNFFYEVEMQKRASNSPANLIAKVIADLETERNYTGSVPAAAVMQRSIDRLRKAQQNL